MTRGFIPRYSPEEYRQRPKEYDPDIAEAILERVQNGDLLPVICDNIDMPLPGTFLRWVDLDPILATEYAKARRRGSEILVDEMVAETMLGRDPTMAGVRSRALENHAKMTDPARYGNRTNLAKTPGSEEENTVDYRSEVRRKLDDLAKKMKASQKRNESGEP